MEITALARTVILRHVYSLLNVLKPKQTTKKKHHIRIAVKRQPTCKCFLLNYILPNSAQQIEPISTTTHEQNK